MLAQALRFGASAMPSHVRPAALLLRRLANSGAPKDVQNSDKDQTMQDSQK